MERDTRMTMIYLCVTDGGYCHAVFSTPLRARIFCDRHPAYHIITRILDGCDE
jgi:hypothetical protein